MLKIIGVIEGVLETVGTIASRVARHDKDLARQMRRAASSVRLNASEESGSSGGTRKACYESALGSMRETLGCLQAAKALGYVREVDAGLIDRIDHVNATLWQLTSIGRAGASQGAPARHVRAVRSGRCGACCRWTLTLRVE